MKIVLLQQVHCLLERLKALQVQLESDHPGRTSSAVTTNTTSVCFSATLNCKMSQPFSALKCLVLFQEASTLDSTFRERVLDTRTYFTISRHKPATLLLASFLLHACADFRKMTML